MQFMEAKLKETQFSFIKNQQKYTTKLIECMFANHPLKPKAAAQVMKNRKWTPKEAQMAFDGLFIQDYGTMAAMSEMLIASYAENTTSNTTSTSVETLIFSDDTAAATLVQPLMSQIHCFLKQKCIVKLNLQRF